MHTLKDKDAARIGPAELIICRARSVYSLHCTSSGSLHQVGEGQAVQEYLAVTI